MKDLIHRIQKHLSKDLLKPKFKSEDHPLAGHCYVASEALFHLAFDGYEQAEWRPHYAVDNQDVAHWWLEDTQGTRLDPTADQYYDTGRVPPYKKGRRASFLTKTPSKRAEKLIERIENERSDH